MKRTALLKSKKGIALESAIVFMIVIFMFCFLITSTAFVGSYRTRINKTKAAFYVEQEQIAEDFIAYMNAPGASNDFDEYLAANQLSYENYDCIEEKTTYDATTRYPLSIIEKKNNGTTALVMIIEAEKTTEKMVKLLSQQRFPG